MQKLVLQNLKRHQTLTHCTQIVEKTASNGSLASPLKQEDELFFWQNINKTDV